MPSSLAPTTSPCLLSSAADIEEARTLIAAHQELIVALLQKQRADDHLEAIIIAASDGVMVAYVAIWREVGAQQVPNWQRHIIKLANKATKPVIIATQMMESMILPALFRPEPK